MKKNYISKSGGAIKILHNLINQLVSEAVSNDKIKVKRKININKIQHGTMLNSDWDKILLGIRLLTRLMENRVRYVRRKNASKWRKYR